MQENSPCSEAGLQPLFDFIVNKFHYHSCETQIVGSVNVAPSDSCGGQGLLGNSIKFCSFEVAKENVWHILELYSNFPAYLDGFKPFSEYVI